MEFIPSEKDGKEHLAKWDWKLCKVWDICKNAIEWICNLLNCFTFDSKVEKKWNSFNQNDNRLDH